MDTMERVTARPYPVRVSGRRDPELSRWLWLVKWAAALPHFVILAFLWLAFVVLTAVAGVAILLTGRYPAAIFDFNVGVLRWTWRVQHYSYGALGTDRYPPFTLADVPDYPARLEIDRPERLSRGLVLVKWWLLAIPHYVIVALFVGGFGPLFDGDGSFPWIFTGLVGVLVLAAGVVLLFTGRYPEPLYDLAVGMDRWALRVAAYAGLMTDAYPPFRLDTGGADPGTVEVDTPAPSIAPEAAATGTGWTARRVTSVVAGAVLALTGSGLAAAGGAMLWADRTQRTDGLLMTPHRHYDTSSYALVSEEIDLPDLDLGRFGPDSLLGTVRVEVPTSAAQPVFVGIARTDDVETFLNGVAHARISDLSRDAAPVLVPGDRVPADPASAGIWVASTAGSPPQALTWDSEGGDWSVVLMPPDGNAGFGLTVRAGAEVPALPWLAGGALGLGGVLLIGGLVLMVVPVTRAAHRV
ncbi:DUF4389 domain-containing protein [Sporichthya polymorpha]|uniref:DUF4389 domain-containing protein n=1 Tax=Sporichthya polymorpha TaxID=35751 RepID=UPI000371B9E0|nr:DUF4389 domain-containing protein [Sporichthya polymorpha]